MSDDRTSRHQLPYLAVAQAMKEITHNEALLRIDALLHPVVEDVLSSPPTAGLADAGKCWLIFSGATGVWQGRDNDLAIWTGGSWRFQTPTEGLRIRNRQISSEMFWSGANWISAPSVADPASGPVVDVEARAAIAALLSYFRTIGMIAM